MKNIAILTYHYSNHNFGALLQTYASVTILRKLGCDPTVINLIPELHKKKPSLFHRLKFFIESNPFENFRAKFIPLTSVIESTNDLVRLNEQFDVFYVGSDQVWRPEFALENLKHYYLDFVAEDKAKLSYAASFGVSSLVVNEETRLNLQILLKRFTAISVREDDGVQICNNVFGVTAEKVLDPTLLLDADDYDKIIEPKRYSRFESEYIAYYQLANDSVLSEDVINIATQYQLRVENIYRTSINLGLRKLTPFSSFSEWLSGIKNAKLVVTDSFHCVIFAIIYRKDFICLENQFGGVSRINSLLNALGLENRLYNSLLYNGKNELLDYNVVFERIGLMRIGSYRFLRNSLEKRI